MTKHDIGKFERAILTGQENLVQKNRFTPWFEAASWQLEETHDMGIGRFSIHFEDYSIVINPQIEICQKDRAILKDNARVSFVCFTKIWEQIANRTVVNSSIVDRPHKPFVVNVDKDHSLEKTY